MVVVVVVAAAAAVVAMVCDRRRRTMIRSISTKPEKIEIAIMTTTTSTTTMMTTGCFAQAASEAAPTIQRMLQRLAVTIFSLSAWVVPAILLGPAGGKDCRDLGYSKIMIASNRKQR